jgi:glycosyltransferase involved in cell wall biosynthesis
MNGIVLSVIIPYYTETKEDLFPLLASLNIQLGIDYAAVECLLVNDGSHNVLPSDFIRLFDKLSIRVIYMEENRGPGMARQTGIDSARGDYVMFCDADDVLQNVHVLNCFINTIAAHKPEMITSAWLGEYYNPANGKPDYFTRENDITWVFGKAFSRLFLQRYGIRFHEDLRVEEDSYFCNLAFVNAQRTYTLPITSYVCKYRAGSITRKDGGAFEFDMKPEFIKSLSLVCAKVEETHPGQMTGLVTRVLVHLFFVLHRQCWLAPEKEEKRKQAEEAFRRLMKPYIHYYRETPKAFFTTIYNGAREKHFVNEAETESLDEWLKRLSL